MARSKMIYVVQHEVNMRIVAAFTSQPELLEYLEEHELSGDKVAVYRCATRETKMYSTREYLRQHKEGRRF